MDNKSHGHNSDKGSGQGRPDREKGSGKSDYREKMQANREQGSSGGEFQPRGRGKQDQGMETSDYRGQAAGNQDNQDAGFSDYKNQAETDRLAAEAQAKKKAGCFPKLFMLLLPFVALGTYLVVRS
jgi:hypothetical protein